MKINFVAVVATALLLSVASAQGTMCCRAMKLSCLSCSAGLTEEEYCADPKLSKRTPECAQNYPHTRGIGSKIKAMFIADETAPCFGPFPKDCLQVKTDPKADWKLFYDHIDGFDFEPGFEYKLEVAVEIVSNPPADGSSLSYQLVQVLSKTKTEAVDFGPVATITKRAPEDVSSSRVCCMSMQLNCLACSAGVTEEQYCKNPNLARQTPECAKFVPAVPAVPETRPKACCMAMLLNCLACSAGVTEEQYCSDPNLALKTPECAKFVPAVPAVPETRPKACCMAMLLNCLACSAGVTEEQYCNDPNLALKTPECAKFVKQSSQPRRCCKSMRLECLACAAGVTESEFCADPRLAATSFECKRVKSISETATTENTRALPATDDARSFVPAVKATANKPRYVKAVKTTPTSAVVTWVASADSDCDVHYLVKYRLKTDGVMGTWQTVERKQDDTSTMAVIEGLMSRRTYQVQVTPITKEGVEGTPTRHAFRTKKFK